MRAARLSDLRAPRTARVPTHQQCAMQKQDSPYECGGLGAQVTGANATTPDPAFVGLIETLNYFAAGRYPPPVAGTPVMPSPGIPVTTGAGSLVTAKIDAALAAVNDMNGDLGVKMKIIEQVNIRLREEIDLSIEFIGIVADADLAEILTRISQDQVSLEASYAVTGELRRLSLANFI